MFWLWFVRNHPGIARHIRDRIGAGDEFAIGQPLVEHTVKPVSLVHIAVDGVFDLVLRVIAEMVILSGHRPETAHLPERPLDRIVAAVEIGGQELPVFSARYSSIAPDSKIEIGLPPPFGA